MASAPTLSFIRSSLAFARMPIVASRRAFSRCPRRSLAATRRIAPNAALAGGCGRSQPAHFEPRVDQRLPRPALAEASIVDRAPGCDRAHANGRRIGDMVRSAACSAFDMVTYLANFLQAPTMT